MKNQILAALKLGILCLVLNSCITRGEVEAYTWLNNTEALAELCQKTPELKDYGFYRKLNDGKLEFISFCNPLAKRMISIIDSDLQKILDENLPKNER